MVTLRSAQANQMAANAGVSASAIEGNVNVNALKRSDSYSSSSATSDDITYERAGDAAEPTSPRTTRQKVDRRPKSTFYLKKKSEMAWDELLCDLATCPEEMHHLKEETLDRGPVPVHSLLPENFFILSRAFLPLAIQAGFQHVFPDYKWPIYVAYPFYTLGIIFFAVQALARLTHYCLKYGTFDEKNIGRDRTPDKSTKNLAIGIISYMVVRTGFTSYLYYDQSVANPLTNFSWTYPLRLAAWELAMDYFFYVYHRSTHEVDYLWNIHQHHHTTKHPTAILAILAEDKQEYLEIFFIPLFATLCVPMTFSEMYVTLCYTLYVEMQGHSGARAHWGHPVLTHILKPFGMELAIEDHDLHHRFGKSGKNYGKQSRVWDTLFGTKGERIETYGM